jgi:hypothetical protein
MNNALALTALIAHVDASDKPVLMGWDEVSQWPEGLLKQFLTLGLVAKDVGAKSLTCAGCENQCTMDVLLTEDAKRAFIVCDHPDMQDQVGRIQVPMERLQQWQVSTQQFASVIAAMLGLDAKPSFNKETASYKLGMLKSEGGRRWANLFTRPLRLEITGHFVPLGDMLFFDGGELVLDINRIQSLLSSSPANVGKAYTPNTNKQEARKAATQAMYQNWRDEYQVLLRKNPNKSEEWYSNQIAKMKIAQGRSAGTIVKNMK